MVFRGEIWAFDVVVPLWMVGIDAFRLGGIGLSVVVERMTSNGDFVGEDVR
jgi:hypothetical protein